MIKFSQIPRIASTHAVTAILILITSFFVSGCLDISTHDTYYVISNSLLVLMIASLFGFFSLTTWGIDKISRRLSPKLNWLHYGITLTCFIIIATLTNSLVSLPNTFEDYSVLDEIDEYESYISMNEWLAIFVLILVLNQLLFLSNVIRAFMIGKKSQ